MKLRHKKHISGISITELAIVIGVFGIVIAGIWSVASSIKLRSQVTTSVDTVNQTVEVVRNIYTIQPLPLGDSGVTAPIPGGEDLAAPMILAGIKLPMPVCTFNWGGTDYITYVSPFSKKCASGLYGYEFTICARGLDDWLAFGQGCWGASTMWGQSRAITVRFYNLSQKECVALITQFEPTTSAGTPGPYEALIYSETNAWPPVKTNYLFTTLPVSSTVAQADCQPNSKNDVAVSYTLNAQAR